MDPRFLPTATATGKSPFESSLCIPPSQTIRFESTSIQPRPVLENLTIIDYEKVKDGREAFYRYQIQVNSTKKSPHRYSEFEWLRNQLTVKYPGCVLPLLPPKEGVSSYIYSHESSFYALRKHGLELFLQSLACHPRLSISEEFCSFLEDDDLNFGRKVRDSMEKPSVFSMIRDVGTSVAATVSWYIYGENAGEGIGNSEVEATIETIVRGLRVELQDIDDLCANLVCTIQTSQVAQLQISIQTSTDLSHAYEAMLNCDSTRLNASYEQHAEAHKKVAGVLRDTEKWFRELEAVETQDYRRTVLGALEAYTRRQQLSSRIVEERQSLQTADRDRALKRIETMESDLQEATADLRRDLESLKTVLEMMRERISKGYINAMAKVSEEMSKVWTDVQGRMGGSTQI